MTLTLRGRVVVAALILALAALVGYVTAEIGTTCYAATIR